eukprot:gene511-1922_t
MPLFVLPDKCSESSAEDELPQFDDATPLSVLAGHGSNSACEQLNLNAMHKAWEYEGLDQNPRDAGCIMPPSYPATGMRGASNFQMNESMSGPTAPDEENVFCSQLLCEGTQELPLSYQDEEDGVDPALISPPCRSNSSQDIADMLQPAPLSTCGADPLSLFYPSLG